MAARIAGRVRRSGNSYVVTIPKQTLIELGIEVGDYVGLQIQPLELRPKLPPDIREALEESWKQNEAAYRYLAEH